LFEEFGVVGLPIVDAQAEFLGPCRFSETVTVTSTIGELRKKSLVVAHEATNGGNLVVNGREIRAWTERHPDDPARLRVVPIPDVMRERLA
jgi:4-hydroxybenzoyl-CoA thioesterase